MEWAALVEWAAAGVTRPAAPVEWVAAGAGFHHPAD